MYSGVWGPGQVGWSPWRPAYLAGGLFRTSKMCGQRISLCITGDWKEGKAGLTRLPDSMKLNRDDLLRDRRDMVQRANQIHRFYFAFAELLIQENTF